MEATIQSINLITTDPRVRDGRPCIRDTGIRVTDIVMANLYHGRSPSDIASDYELDIAKVYAALAYYYEHKTDLDSDIRKQIVTALQYKDQIGG